jgi:hypothetical protein
MHSVPDISRPQLKVEHRKGLNPKGKTR